MKLPSVKDYPMEIHVGDETYVIRFVSRMPKNEVGLCDDGAHVILIKRGMSKAQTFRTVVHEVLHAIEFEYQLKVPHKLVYQLEKAIVDVLLMNL
jgi:hypothetical protein